MRIRDASDVDGDTGDDEGIPEHDGALDEAREWRERAADVIPGGASTGSKRPAALYGSDATLGPTHFVRASGCELIAVGGESFLDCTMALGAVAIGYADEAVSRAVIEATLNGHVAGLSPALEVQVAERLCDIVPCAEQVRFLKTGAEAVAAAVRVARAYTGRDQVIGAGYFGWLDWWNAGKGIPSSAHEAFSPVTFDDVGALERAARDVGDRLAAVLIEPVVERLPSPEWIAAARSLCDRTGAILIFDEIKTGFRLRPGGYQELSGVEPDLATFGKAMANGFPLAAVVGRAEVMGAARETWISSTLASESTALAAANAVLDWHEKAEVCETLAQTGEEMMAAVRRAIEACGIAGVSVEGIAPMWLMRFDAPDRQSRFLELALDQGVLFKHGAYNFPSLAHGDEAIAHIEQAASTALVALLEEEEE